MVGDSLLLNKVLPIDLTRSIRTFEILREPLSEQVILELQDKFLTNGFHYIKVPNQVVGRTLVERFVSSLQMYHHDGACVTLSEQQLPPMITHVYRSISNKGYLDPFDIRDMEEFFIEDFYYDFMWIEATKELLATPWFIEFEKILLDFHMEKHIPIVVVLYEHE